jgi:protein-tyrosine phosphatase
MLNKTTRFVRKGVRILVERVQTQGVRTTLLWAYGRGIAKVTGIPPLRFSKITDQLYVGPQFDQKGKAHLEANGIHACVNLRVEFDDAEYGLNLAHYCYLPTVDDDAPSQQHLEAGVAFIRQRIEAGDKVYIHCAGGVGRAPTMAAAYLISTGLSITEALDVIRAARPFITPTRPQMSALRQYEAAQRRSE